MESFVITGYLELLLVHGINCGVFGVVSIGCGVVGVVLVLVYSSVG